MDAILVGILATLVVDRINTLPDHKYALPDMFSVFLLGLSLLLLGDSLYYALVVTRPAISRMKDGGLFYFAMIRAYSHDDFIARFESLTPLQVHRDLLAHVYSLAGIAQRNYRRSAVSLNMLLACLYL